MKHLTCTFIDFDGVVGRGRAAGHAGQQQQVAEHGGSTSKLLSAQQHQQVAEHAARTRPRETRNRKSITG